MADETNKPPVEKSTAELTQQDKTIAQLKVDGWVNVQESVAADGSILMQLTTPAGVSHIIVMLNGDRVDQRQKLGKDTAIPNSGEP